LVKSVYSGLKKLVETVRKASAGATQNFLFKSLTLSVKRRQTKRKSFERFLEINERHWDRHRWRHGRRGLAKRRRSAGTRVLQRSLMEIGTRSSLSGVEALKFGYRERVPTPYSITIRRFAEVLPEYRAAAGGQESAGCRWRRTATMPTPIRWRKDSQCSEDRNDGDGGPTRAERTLAFRRFIKHPLASRTSTMGRHSRPRREVSPGQPHRRRRVFRSRVCKAVRLSPISTRRKFEDSRTTQSRPSCLPHTVKAVRIAADDIFPTPASIRDSKHSAVLCHSNTP